MLDFGLARELNNTYAVALAHSLAGSELVDSTISIAGTPGYLAPEQLNGRSASAATDQFAFAVTCCQAFFVAFES